MEENYEILLEKLVNYFLSLDYETVKKFVDDQDSRTQRVIGNLVESEDFFYEIASKKHRLGSYIFKDAGVVYFPEDRTRAVFLLAKFANSNFKATEAAFKSEFGDSFVLRQNYPVGNKNISWKVMALKAKGVKNAYRILDMFLARHYLEEIFNIYRVFKETDPQRLQRIVDLSELYLAGMVKRAINPGKSKELDDIRRTLLEILKLCGWLEIDIQKAETTLDFEKYTDFISKIEYVCIARLYLIYNNKPIDKYHKAEVILLQYLANVVAASYRMDSIIRKGVKLKPLAKKQVSAV